MELNLIETDEGFEIAEYPFIILHGRHENKKGFLLKDLRTNNDFSFVFNAEVTEVANAVEKYLNEPFWVENYDIDNIINGQSLISCYINGYKNSDTILYVTVSKSFLEKDTYNVSVGHASTYCLDGYDTIKAAKNFAFAYGRMAQEAETIVDKMREKGIVVNTIG